MAATTDKPAEKPAARLVSPLFFVLAIVLFVLPFVGVSCNTDAAKPLLSAAGPDGPSAQCLDSVKALNLETYSGLNLAIGSAPAINTGATTTAPAGCPPSSSNSSNSNNGLGQLAADKLKLSPQPLILVGLAVILVGLVVGALRIAFRGFIAAACAVVAAVLVFVGEQSAGTAAINALATQAQSNGSSGGLPPGVTVQSFFLANPGIGLWLVIAALALAALFNVASPFILRGGHTAAGTGAEAYPGGGYAPSSYPTSPQSPQQPPQGPPGYPPQGSPPQGPPGGYGPPPQA
ncbi:MAG: hypothetical protein ACR2GX_01445 [Candidatus Dormibacteria bacterium]